MIRVDPFRESDLALIRVQPVQAAELAASAHAAAFYARAGNAFTVRDRHDRVVMCAGALEHHAEHASLWCVLAADIGGAMMLALTRRVRMFIKRQRHRRLDCQVRLAHREGHRWAELLGLTVETHLTDYYPNGETVVFYRRRAR